MSYDMDGIGLYDIEEERKRIENTMIANALEEGAKDEKKSIAKAMLSKNMEIPLISEITGLSKKQLSKLI